MALNQVEKQDKIKQLEKHIVAHDNFPKPGILFRDFLPIFHNPKTIDLLLELLINEIKSNYDGVEAIFALESRGFLIGTLLAYSLKLPFLPIRKEGKLPGKTFKLKYSLEYGEDVLEIQEDYASQYKNCIIVDDLLATGGTLNAAVSLAEKAGINVLASLVVIELNSLEGRKLLEKKNHKVHSLVQY